MKEDIRELVVDMTGDDETLFCDGFDEAIIGVARVFDRVTPLYDYDTCISILMERDESTYEQAVEHLEFNTLGAWVGPKTPAFFQVSEDIRAARACMHEDELAKKIFRSQNIHGLHQDSIYWCQMCGAVRFGEKGRWERPYESSAATL